MALFIADLGLEAPVLDRAKMGVLLAFALAAVLGMTLSVLFLPKREPQAP